MSETKTRVTVPTRKTNRQWASAATKVVGATPRMLGRKSDETYIKRVWVGIVRENCPDVSLKEVASLADLKVAHSTVHCLYEGWKSLPWRVRHGWLMMAESAINSRADWLPAVWHQEIHELSCASLAEVGSFTRWHDPISRLRRPMDMDYGRRGDR